MRGHKIIQLILLSVLTFNCYCEDEYDSVCLPTEEVELACGAASDKDCYYPNDKLEADYGFTYFWSARWKISGYPAGEFKNDDNEGQTVTWIAPAGSGDVIVTVTADSGYDKYNDIGSDEKIIRVATVTLESVTFGGSKKHALKKKGPNQSDQWDPGDEDYGTDYGTTVPDKAWTRDPAFSDPVCYTKGSSGSDCTATIELSIEPSLTESVSGVDINGLTPAYVGGEFTIIEYFKSTVNISGSSIEIGPMNLSAALQNSVDSYSWALGWRLRASSNAQLYTFGGSQNELLLTWATPGGSDEKTAKRMDWCCSEAAPEADTAELVADRIHEALGSDPPEEPGTCSSGEESDKWELLDGCPYYGHCNYQSLLMKRGVDLIGLSGAYTDLVYASSNSGAGNCLDLEDGMRESNKVWLILDFNTGSGYNWNAFEGVCVVVNKWYAIWPNEKADNDYDMLVNELGPQQYWVKTENDIAPGTPPSGWEVEIVYEEEPLP